ncbi:MAG: flippase [Opitutaceae bacterium]
MIPQGKPFENVAWLVTERMLRLGTSTLVMVIVARHLTPAGFGELSVALAAVALAMPLAQSGLDALVVAELIRRPGDTGTLLGTSAAMRLGAGLMVLLPLFGYGRLIVSASVLIPVSLLLLFQAGEVTDLWFQRHLRSRWTAGARFTALTLGAVVKLWLVWRGAGVIWFAWAQAIESFLFSSALALAYRRAGGRFADWRFDGRLAGSLLSQSWLLALSGMTVAIFMQLDQLLVKHWLDAGAAGCYAAANRIIELPLFITAALTMSLFPGLTASHGDGGETFRVRLQEVFDLLSIIGWIVVLGLSLLGPSLIRVLFGGAYAPAAAVLVIKVWACLFLFSGSVRGQFIVLTAAAATNLTAAVVGIVVQVALAWWLIPGHGIAGAALAFVVASAVSGWMLSFALPALTPCAGVQTSALLIPFFPHRWKNSLRPLFLP